MKIWVCVTISIRPTGQPVECPYVAKTWTLQVSQTQKNMMNVKLSMVVELIKLYPFIALSVTFILFQGHSSVKILTENSMFLSD